MAVYRDFFCYGAILLLTLVLILLLIKYAHKLQLIDIPNKRSIHKQPIPRGAGVAIILSVIMVSIFKIDFYLEYWWVLLAIVLVFAVGIYDDIFNASPGLKFLLIFGATAVVYFNGISIEDIGILGGIKLVLPWWAGAALHFFATAGYTNAFNLFDGLDGLSVSVGSVILGAYVYVGYI